MRGLDPELVDTVWAAVEPLLAPHAENHPLGCHRPRIPDRDCFEMMLVHLVTGTSWEDCERLCGNKVSDTTARARRDEWEEVGVFDAIAEGAISSYDKIIGLDLTEVAVDGSLQKSPAGTGTTRSCSSPPSTPLSLLTLVVRRNSEVATPVVKFSLVMPIHGSGG